MKNKKSKLVCLILILCLLISTMAVLAGCDGNIPLVPDVPSVPEVPVLPEVPDLPDGIVIEFYVGDEVIETYTLDGLINGRFPEVEPKDGKVFFEWCCDYNCEESFSGTSIADYPIRNGIKLKLYAKMVDPLYIECDRDEVDGTDEISIKSNYNSAVIFEDLIFVGESSNYKVYSDASCTTEFTDYAYTMVKDEKIFYIKVSNGNDTRTVVLNLYNRKDQKISIDCYIYSLDANSGRENFTGDYEKDLIINYYAGDIVNLKNDYLAEINLDGYEIIGFTYNHPQDSVLQGMRFIDVETFNISNRNNIYIIIKKL